MNLPADRLQPDRVATSREPGQHLLHRHLAQHLRRAEQPIRRDRQFARPVGDPHPRPGHQHPPAAQGHRPALTPVAHRGSRHDVLAPRPGQRTHVGLHQRHHDLQTGATARASSALVHVLGNLGHRHPDPLRDRGRARLHRLDLATLLHGGPLSVGVSWQTPDTYHTAGLERGTATSSSTKHGTTSSPGRVRRMRLM